MHRAREEDCLSRTARDEGSHAKMANVQMRGQRPARREDVEAGCTREAEEHVYARRARVCTQSSTMSSAQHSRARRAGRTRRSERTRGEQCERPPAKTPGRMDRTAHMDCSLARPALLCNFSETSEQRKHVHPLLISYFQGVYMRIVKVPPQISGPQEGGPCGTYVVRCPVFSSGQKQYS